ncbi:MAG: hypothetical protein ACXVWZ_12990 [Nocardioides sp.]
MRTHPTTIGTLAVVATSALIGLGGAAQARDTTTAHERGHVLECTGTSHGKHVYASLYDNDAFENVLLILVGNRHQLGRDRHDAEPYVQGRRVLAAMRIGGSPAVVRGTAVKHGPKRPVHEEFDDAGQHLVIDGFQKKLRTDLTFTWRGTTVPLTCSPAFAFNLHSTRTDLP